MHSRTNGRRERAGDAETKVNLKSSFLFFYTSPKQIFCFRNCRFCFFQRVASLALPSVRSSVPIALMLRPSVRPSVPPSERKLARFAAKNALELTAGAPLFRKCVFLAPCSLRALVRPSFHPSVPLHLLTARSSVRTEVGEILRQRTH